MLAITVLTLVLYGHTLSFPFVFDDWVYLIENPLAITVPTFAFWLEPKEFANIPMKMGLDTDIAVNIMLRPFAYFTFYWNYLAGGKDPTGYRLVNIVLHAFNGCFVFLILRHILLRSQLKFKPEGTSVIFIPLASALVFISHPLQIESVTYVIQRFTSMAGFFFLLTTWLHLQGGLMNHGYRRVMLRIVTVVILLVGMLTKETLVMAPILILMIDWLLIGTSFKTSFWRASPMLICMLVVPLMVFYVSWAQNNGSLKLYDALNLVNRDDEPRPHLKFLLNEFGVIIRYLGLILYPTNLNLDPDIRSYESLLDWHIFISGAAILTIIAGAWLVFRRQVNDLRRAMLLVFTLWFFVVVSVSSGVVPLPDLMAEHRTYLPSVGAIIVLVCLLDWLRIRIAATGVSAYAAYLLLVVWVGCLSWSTLSRNEVWSSRRSLWEDTAAKSPDKLRPLANLGVCHGEEGRLDDAVACFKKVLAKEPRFITANVNLTSLLITQQKFPEAHQACIAALQNGVDTPIIRHNFGLALCNLGNLDKGISVLESVVERRPDFRSTRVALGKAYYQTQRADKALVQLKEAASTGPEDPELRKAIHQIERELKLIQ